MIRNSLILAVCAAFITLFTTGCATGDRPIAGIYTNSSYDIQGTTGPLANLKVGTAEAKNYFGLVGLGDCSIDTATKNGGIKDIKYIDRSLMTILGFSTITTKVYGN
jgi:hypothetical protein